MTNAGIAVNLDAGDRLREKPLDLELGLGGPGYSSSKMENCFPDWSKPLDARTDEHEGRASQDAVCQKEIAETVGVVGLNSPPLHDAAHSNLLPALGTNYAWEILEHNNSLASSKFDSAPHYYGWLFQGGTQFATVAGVA
jgi:hypothetical protein